MAEQLGYFLAGGFLMAVTSWLVKCFIQPKDDVCQKVAEETLRQHNLKAEFYLATIGTEDRELRAAMDYFSFRGYLILNKSNEVVGRICPKVKKGSHLRLVVSNHSPRG